MAVHHFTLEYWLDEDWYVGRLKEVPGVFSQGETVQELKKNIQEAYQLMVEESEEEMGLPSSAIRKEIKVNV